MVWPPSVKGILVTESVRGDGGILKNSQGARFMFDYVPDVFRNQYAETAEEADRWYTDPDNNRRPPELLPRDEVARAINAEVKAGRGTPAGGVYLDIASRRPAEFILKRLPSMYHQFKELADVDITKQPMEIGPTCHYVMGGVEVDPDTGSAVAGPHLGGTGPESPTGHVEGLFAAGEVSGGMHGSNRLGGNSLSDLLVFGKRAGEYAALYVDQLTARPAVAQDAIDAAAETALAPLTREGGENPYTVWSDLQQVMQDLVGIIRRKSELEESLKLLADIRERAKNLTAPGGRRFNPGWHLALDLRNMLIVSEATAKAALEREESRGGHTREDFPKMDPTWRQTNLVCSLAATGEVALTRKPVPALRPELLGLFELSELKKYMTDEELASYQPAKDGE
jgi:succinate dehydrogenase / fumarate reductase flavoprotein subunit